MQGPPNRLLSYAWSFCMQQPEWNSENANQTVQLPCLRHSVISSCSQAEDQGFKEACKICRIWPSRASRLIFLSFPTSYMAGIRHTGSFLFVESDMPPPPGPVLTYIDPFLTVSLLYPFLSFLIVQLLAQARVPEWDQFLMFFTLMEPYFLF